MTCSRSRGFYSPGSFYASELPLTPLLGDSVDRDNKEGWSLVKEPIPLGPRVLWEHPQANKRQLSELAESGPITIARVAEPAG